MPTVKKQKKKDKLVFIKPKKTKPGEFKGVKSMLPPVSGRDTKEIGESYIPCQPIDTNSFKTPQLNGKQT